jgi:hypothetical protein
MYGRGSIPVRGRDFSRDRIQIGYGAQSSYLIGTGCETTGVKRLIPRLSMCVELSTRVCVFMAHSSVKYSDNFTFTFKSKGKVVPVLNQLSSVS